jgi:hypothetical protein
MKKQNDRGDSIIANISGPISGQVAVGKGITQTQRVGATAGFTEQEEAEFRNLFAELKERVAAEAPPDKKTQALEQVEELHQALSVEKPDRATLTKMEKVKNWFVKYAPKVVGVVTSVFIHPLVGKLVEAGGDVLAEEVRHCFAEPDVAARSGPDQK